MLLALYIEDDTQPVKISTLVEAAGRAMIARLRCVNALKRERLVEWEAQPSVRRTHMVAVERSGSPRRW